MNKDLEEAILDLRKEDLFYNKKALNKNREKLLLLLTRYDDIILSSSLYQNDEGHIQINNHYEKIPSAESKEALSIHHVELLQPYLYKISKSSFMKEIIVLGTEKNLSEALTLIGYSSGNNKYLLNNLQKYVRLEKPEGNERDLSNASSLSKNVPVEINSPKNSGLIEKVISSLDEKINGECCSYDELYDMIRFSLKEIQLTDKYDINGKFEALYTDFLSLIHI